MRLPNPGPRYDQQTQVRLQRELETADGQNRKAGQNIELVTEVLILRSPNGTRYKLTVSNAGVLSAVLA